MIDGILNIILNFQCFRIKKLPILFDFKWTLRILNLGGSHCSENFPSDNPSVIMANERMYNFIQNVIEGKIKVELSNV